MEDTFNVRDIQEHQRHGHTVDCRAGLRVTRVRRCGKRKSNRRQRGREEIRALSQDGSDQQPTVAAAQDGGISIIDPEPIEGQLQGGVAQGIGWALNEEYIHDDSGTMENPGFLDYRIPVASDLPMIDTVVVEVPNPAHPYGVRGVGEVGIVPPLAAVANAVDDAVDRRITDLPLSPVRILDAILNSED